MESKGWVKLNRKILNWEWYQNENVMRLFIHCLLKANHQDAKWQGIEIKRGSFITSYQNLSRELKLSVEQIRTAIKKLSKLTHEITYQSTSQYSIIVVNNYDLYQSDNTPDTEQITNKQQTDNKQITTNKNVKKEKNEKEYIYTFKKFNEKKELILKEAENLYPDKNCVQAIEDFIEYCELKKVNYKRYELAFYKWVRDDRFDKYKLAAPRVARKSNFSAF